MFRLNNQLIKGAFYLTITSFVCKIIGFFYRIFLSRIIGAEGLGIYQMIFPVYGLCFSFCTVGIETAISNLVAKCTKKDTQKKTGIMYTGLLMSLILSIFIASLLYIFSLPIATYILLEPRCSTLLRYIAYSIPFGAFHTCIHGYYFGLRKTLIPAISNIVEQVIRVLTVFTIYIIAYNSNNNLSPVIAVIGILAGEIASCIYNGFTVIGTKIKIVRNEIRKIFNIAYVISINHLILNLLSSAEAILLPICLRKYGMSVSNALIIYGTLTGMAFPFILFPCSVTSALSHILMPTISHDSTHKSTNKVHLASTIKKSILFCFGLGIVFFLIFGILGRFIGNLVFNNELAGKYISSLSFVCPFLYSTTVFASILNGLSLHKQNLINNLISISVRLLFVILLVPTYSINAYIAGLVVSQIVCTLLHLRQISKYLKL